MAATKPEGEFAVEKPKFKQLDTVIVSTPVRWGLPLGFDGEAKVVKAAFWTRMGWTATVQVDGLNYEINESDLTLKVG